ncbi:MAG TPA: hypothetical protein VMF69_22160 [Gemmataceae bacterium]|nr:hypothetical protein [Gemmataceae bacterium]
MYKFTSIALLFALTVGLAADQTPAPVAQTDAGKQSLAKIRQFGGLALELAQNDPHLEVSYIQNDGKFSDEHLAVLKDLKGLVHLDLRGQPVTDAQTAHLKPLTELTHLHLEKTKITDKGLENLKGLVNLEYLNLYSTAVSDAGLTNLEGMKKLKHLYVWQTKVTDAGAAKLKKAIPGVDINLGFKEEPIVAKKEEKKPENKIAVKKTEPKKEEKKPEPKAVAKKPEPKKEEKKPEPKIVAKRDDKKPDPNIEVKKPEPPKDTKAAEEMTALLKARVALAEKAYHESWEEFGRTQRIGNVLVLVGKPEDVYAWSVRWLKAQRDRSSKQEEQVAALEDHLKRMTELQKRVKLVAKDLLSPRAESDAEWYRLEAQLWLAKAKQAKAK